MAKKTYPKVGLAFSGASSRSIFYIGFLEVLQENDFPIDYIAAMSSSSAVAASFSCGSMEAFKKLAIDIDKEVIFNLIERSKGKGGLYHLDKVEEMVRFYTKNYNFEDVYPRLGFVATDITAGEEVTLQVGDIARAICASCALPAIFKPVEWGNKQLIDGGIMNVVPGNVAQHAGMDVVIGVNMQATRFVFSSWQISLKRYLNTIKRILWPNQAEQMWQRISSLLDYTEYFSEYPQIVDDLKGRRAYPNLFSVLGRSLDLAIEAQRHSPETKNYNCDLLIIPEVNPVPFYKRFLLLHFTDFSRTEEYYLSGRHTAQKYLPQMWQLLADKELNNMQQTKDVEMLLKETLQ